MKKQVTFVEQEMKLVANFGQTHRVSDGGFERGYEQGVTVGYKNGHAQGVIDGYENGHEVGVQEGYANGYEQGVDFVEKQVEEIENGSY